MFLLCLKPFTEKVLDWWRLEVGVVCVSGRGFWLVWPAAITKRPLCHEYMILWQRCEWTLLLRFEHQQEVFNFSDEVMCGGAVFVKSCRNKQAVCILLLMRGSQSEATPRDLVGCTDVCCYTSSVHFQVKPARDLMSQHVKHPLMRRISQCTVILVTVLRWTWTFHPFYIVSVVVIKQLILTANMSELHLNKG